MKKSVSLRLALSIGAILLGCGALKPMGQVKENISLLNPGNSKQTTCVNLGEYSQVSQLLHAIDDSIRRGNWNKVNEDIKIIFAAKNQSEEPIISISCDENRMLSAIRQQILKKKETIATVEDRKIYGIFFGSICCILSLVTAGSAAKVFSEDETILGGISAVLVSSIFSVSSCGYCFWRNRFAEKEFNEEKASIEAVIKTLDSFENSVPA